MYRISLNCYFKIVFFKKEKEEGVEKLERRKGENRQSRGRLDGSASPHRLIGHDPRSLNRDSFNWEGGVLANRLAHACLLIF